MCLIVFLNFFWVIFGLLRLLFILVVNMIFCCDWVVLLVKLNIVGVVVLLLIGVKLNLLGVEVKGKIFKWKN